MNSKVPDIADKCDKIEFVDDDDIGLMKNNLITATKHSKLLENWGKEFQINFAISVYAEPKQRANIFRITTGSMDNYLPAVYLDHDEIKIHTSLPGRVFNL